MGRAQCPSDDAYAQSTAGRKLLQLPMPGQQPGQPTRPGQPGQAQIPPRARQLFVRAMQIAPEKLLAQRWAGVYNQHINAVSVGSDRCQQYFTTPGSTPACHWPEAMTVLVARLAWYKCFSNATECAKMKMNALAR